MHNGNVAQQYYETGGAKGALAVATILRTLNAYSPMTRALDVGCGDGCALEALTAYGSIAVGVDTSDEAIALARNRAPRVEVVKADTQQGLPFGDKTFDVALLLDVVEHLENPFRALAEVRRVLKEGGYLAITTPNANSPIRLIRGRRWFALRDPHHLLFFTAFTLAHLLQQAGFEIVTSRVEAFTDTIADPLFRALRIGGTLFFIARRSP